MGYMGSNWIKSNLNHWDQSPKRKPMSKLGKSVADLLGDVFLGIYHLSYSSLKKTDWTDNYCVEYIHSGDLATVDFNELTRIVILAHDRMIRVSIKGVGPGYMKMLFHQRTKRSGSINQRCPTIEDHTAAIRKHYDEA